jgi:acetolactate synthase-1/2/3 large subunit
MIHTILKLSLIQLQQKNVKKKYLKVKKLKKSNIQCGVKGYDILYSKIKQHTPKHIFCISGGPIMSLVDTFHYDEDVEMIVPANEQTMLYMMKGYSSITSPKCFGLVTSGPGLTNCITGLLDAKNDGVPLMLISGQVDSDKIGTGAFQECDAISLTKTVTKMNCQITNVESISTVFDILMKIAYTGRQGPVHIDIPKDVLNADFEPRLNMKYMLPSLIEIHPSKYTITNERFQEIGNMVNKSKKPLIIAGNGANHASEILTLLVNIYKIPITTTLHGIGVYDENNELSLKMHGMHGSIYANKAIQESDCIIAIGNRFDDRTIGNIAKYAPIAYNAMGLNRGGIIHCNIDETAFNNNIHTSHNFQCDSKEFVSRLFSNMKRVKRNKWLSKISHWKDKYPFRFDNHEYLTTQYVLYSINKYIQQSIIKHNLHITTGVGNHQMMTCQFINHTYPNRVTMSGSLGVMGVGLPYAIGIKLANPKAIVLDIDGDSSFNMSFCELKTISQYNIPIKIAILNDHSQSMVRTWESMFYNNRITATNNEINPLYANINKIFPNIKCLKCESKEYIAVKISDMFLHNGPVICEFNVQTEKCYPFIKPNQALDENYYHDKWI